MKSITYSFAIFFTLLFIGCSSKPSEDDAMKVVQNLIQTHAGNFIELVSFKKTNAQDITFGGMQLYKVMYTAQLRFLRKGMMLRISQDQPYEFYGVNGYDYYNSFDKFVGDAGSVATINSFIIFSKTENGWQPEWH